MKRIIMLVPRFFPEKCGGRARLTQLISLYLAKKGYEVLILTNWKGYPLKKYGYGRVRVIRYTIRRDFTRKPLSYLYKVVSNLDLFRFLMREVERGYEIVHVHAPLYEALNFPPGCRSIYKISGLWSAMKILKKTMPKLKIIYHFHGSVRVLEGNTCQIYRSLSGMENSDTVITLSKLDTYIIKRMLKEKGRDVPVNTLYNPAHPRFFKIGEEPILPQIRKNVLYAGGSDPKKGYLLFKRLKKKLKGILNFTAVGPGLKYIEWELMPYLYRYHGIVIIPSLKEGQPLILNESMAAGRPVVASNIGAISEILDGELGWLLSDPTDFESFYNKVVMLYENEEKYSYFSKRIREKAKELLDFNRYIEKLIEIYED